METRVEAISRTGGIVFKPALKRHVITGLLAGLLLLAVYTAILVPAQGFQHALQQALDLWYWLLILVTGFGVQAGLFSFIRQGLRERQKSLTAGLASSGGVSAGAMAACCAHHLSDVLALLGISGLAAFLVNYQVFFIVIGVMANIVGITLMLETIQRHGLSTVIAGWRVNMGPVKKIMMVSSGIVILVAFLVTYT